MIRAVLYLLLTVLVLTLLRAIIGVVSKALTSQLQPNTGQPGRERSGGQLRRDPVCGAYVSEDVSTKKTVGNKTFYFCSPACRDKHQTG